MDSSKTIIGRAIKEQRIKRGLTLKELADKLDVEKQYIWRLENGKINMSPDYIDKVLKQLEITPRDFFTQFNKANNT